MSVLHGLFGSTGTGVAGQYIAPQYEDLTGQFNTPLSPQEEEAFQQWRARLPRNLQNMSDYDLRGAWKSNAKAATNGHLPDTWKKPNHPTFSKESQYSNPAMQGGEWADAGNGKWNYWASPANARYRSMGETQGYFNEAEPGSNVIFPSDYKLPPK